MNFLSKFFAVCLLLASLRVAFCGEVTKSNAKPNSIPACSNLLAAAELNGISLSGFDPLSGTNALRSGDSATVLITFVQKEKRTQWLLYLEATPDSKSGATQKNAIFEVRSSFGPPIKFESKPVPAKLRLIGPFAASSATKQSKVYDTGAEFSLNEDFLRLGLDQAAALLWRWSQQTNFNGSITSKALLAMKPTAAEQRAVCGTFPALFSYVDIVQHTEGLEGLFFKLVEMPSLWSMIRHGGVNANISFDNKALPSPANPKDWNLPTNAPIYYFPFLLRLNDQPALKITLVVTSPRKPLLICGGVVGLLAEKIDDEQTYMSLRLISARADSNGK